MKISSRSTSRLDASSALTCSALVIPITTASKPANHPAAGDNISAPWRVKINSATSSHPATNGAILKIMGLTTGKPEVSVCTSQETGLKIAPQRAPKRNFHNRRPSPSGKTKHQYTQKRGQRRISVYCKFHENKTAIPLFSLSRATCHCMPLV